MYHRGDIVLVPFPYTDLSAVKTRPAVVVSVEAFEEKTGNVTVAMITSVMRETSFDSEIKDWKSANLLAQSWVRAKLVTLDPRLIRYRPGRLTQSDLSNVNGMLRSSLGLQ